MDSCPCQDCDGSYDYEDFVVEVNVEVNEDMEAEEVSSE